jgi:hypothetical protein
LPPVAGRARRTLALEAIAAASMPLRLSTELPAEAAHAPILERRSYRDRPERWFAFASLQQRAHFWPGRRDDGGELTEISIFRVVR